MNIRFNKLIKKTLSVFLVVLMAAFITNEVAFSAPDRLLPGETKSNTSSLIRKLNIAKQKVITSDSEEFLITGQGEEDTEVTVYFLNESKNYYERKADANGDGDSKVIGALGFRIQVELSNGLNRLLIYAKKGKQVQIKRVDVILDKKSSDYFERNEYTNFSQVLNGFSNK